MKDNYDKNDKFAELLGDKLRGHLEEPPVDMFDRIERTLAAVAPVESAPAEEEMGGAVVVPLWRRVWSRGVAVAMAAAMVAVALVVALRQSAPEEIVALTEQMAVATGLDEQQVEVPQAVAESEEAVAVAMVAAPRTNSVRNNIVEQALMTTTNVDGEVVAIPAHNKEESKGSVEKSEGRREKSKYTSSTRRSSRRRNTAEVEEYWRDVWDDSRFEVPERNVTMAIHASGVGVGKMEMAHRTNNSMMINEQSNIPTSGFMSPQMVGKSPATPKLEHFMPISVGVTLNFSITDYLSVESGLLYTSLSSKGESTGTISLYECWRKMNYLGVPLSLSLNVVDYGPLSLYARLGTTLELNMTAKDKVFLDGELMQTNNLDTPLVTLSMDGAVGVDYNFVENLSLFGELGGSYWFTRPDYPENYRTVKPLTLSGRVGLKIAFN